MSQNFILLNFSKTDFIIFIQILGETNIGVMSRFNPQLECDFWFSNIKWKNMSLALRRRPMSIPQSIFGVRKFLSRSDAEKLVHVLVTPRSDSCTSLLAALHNAYCIEICVATWWKFRSLITKTWNYDHAIMVEMDITGFPYVKVFSSN